MFITGIGTATPPHRYHQSECWTALEGSDRINQLSLRSRAILKKVLRGNNGILTRHLALDPLEEAFQLGPDVLQARFTKHAPTVAAAAARNALQDAELKAGEVDALIVSTCTGYLCPGLTSYVSELLGLRADALLLDLVGQGCGAAIPNMRTGEALIESGRAAKVLSVCVEICSAVFYLDDDPGVLISACLFGDGAGAAILSKEPNQRGRSIKWRDSKSVIAPEARDLLRFEHTNGMLRNVLSPEVPTLAAKYFEEVLTQTLIEQKLQLSDIKGWIVHAGGRDVLAALQQRMQFSPETFCLSAKILEEYGNLSSPFVYFVLQEALRRKTPGGYWWLASFGAGFSSHGVLLEVE
ncbi:MAG: Chalcone and stilbene synthase domain protein [Verrucomicrobiales bacterium]|nr:Chalcone and stilbene synthase domain protein [Verrucomicrobiales bacterium]